MKLNVYISLILCSLLSVSCSDYYELPNSGSGTTSNDVVEWMDDILSIYYLYNDEYNTLDRDLTKSYSSFLTSTLTSMTTNVLDYKDGSLYSYITCTASTKSGEVDTRISDTKYRSWSIGLAMVSSVSYSSTTRQELAVYAVTDGSPLYNAGVRRGDYIKQVNDVTLKQDNIYTYANMLLSPTSGESYKLLMGDGETVTVSPEYIYSSPILVSDVWEVGDKKVGYLSYLSFDAAYDSELLDVMSDFKSQGVSEMILDMRLNGGGYVDSSNKLSTAIAGSASSGEVFTYFTYNPTRGEAVVEFLSNQSSYHLDLSRLYCLVGGYTASASELVINSLRGIGIEVVLIGSTTEGKNAAMEIFSSTLDGYDYEFAPITIALSNAVGFGDYAEGFTPDYPCDDWGTDGDDFSDFTQDEIMIRTALELIAGESSGESVQSVTRTSDNHSVRGVTFSAGNIKRGNLVVSDEN